MINWSLINDKFNIVTKKNKKSDQKKQPVTNEKQNQGEKMTNSFGWVRKIILLLAVVLIVGLMAGWAMEISYAGKVAYGLRLGDFDLGGMTRSQLAEFFADRQERYEQGLAVTGQNLSADNQFDYTAVGMGVDLDQCQKQIWEYGRYQNFWPRLFSRLRAASGQLNISCEVFEDQFDYNNWLNGLRERVNQPAVSAAIEKGEDDFKVIQASQGMVFDEDKLLSDLKNKLSGLDLAPIILVEKPDYPVVSDQMVSEALSLAQTEMSRPMQWQYEDWTIEITSDDIYQMLYFEQKNKVDCHDNVEATVNDQGQVLCVGYDLAVVDRFLNERATAFEDRPQNPRLAMTATGPVVVETGTTGQMVNRVKLITDLENNLGQSKDIVKLPVEVMESVIATGNLAELGIKELIATGSSDFSYSPANRIHNISVGAENFNGMVLAPGEEFSFTTLLGSVDAASGYLPELVIAGNETKPEYGGGLCQVSTTMYRTALDAGFPITARTPHRYRVSYYEPAGQDATVYIPNPDLRFVNDTKHYVLIEAVISGAILTFNFYGTNDGRQVEVTEPVIFNITSPPAPEYIYTNSLAPGQKVQVDSAHYGADSIFYRYITNANGETKEEEIFSRYQAWAAKYKVGEGEPEPTDNKSDLVDDSSDVPVLPEETDVSGTA